MKTHRREAAPRSRGFLLGAFVWRLMVLLGLFVVAYGAYQEPDHARAISRTLSTRLQALLPVGTDGEGTEALVEGYRRLQENSMVGLYGAWQIFHHAATMAESDVAARSGEADAQVALSHAYEVSAALMEAYSKTLTGPERRASERLVKDERRQSQGHLREGQQLAKEALRINPTAFVAQRAMAGALLQAGRLERARPYLAQANAARPQDPWVRDLLAQQKSRKDAGQAIALYQDLLTLEPQHNGARLRMALLHWAAGDRVSARQDALVILAASPGHALAQRLLMELEPLASHGPQMTRLMPLPRQAEVQALLPPLIDEGPGPKLPALSMRPGDIFSAATAKRLVVRGVTLGGRGVIWAHAHLLALWRAGRDHVQTWDSPQSSAPVASGPEAPRGIEPSVVATAHEAIALAKAFEARRQRPEAEYAWRRALALDGSQVEALIALGWCRLYAHDTDEAKQQFERAIALVPDNAEAHFGLAEAHRMAHNTQAAKEHYEAYLRLEPRGPLGPLCRQMLEELGHDR